MAGTYKSQKKTSEKSMPFEKKVLIQGICAVMIFAYCFIVSRTNSATAQKEFIHKAVNISSTKEDVRKWISGTKVVSKKAVLYSIKTMDTLIYFFENGFGPTETIPKETALAMDGEMPEPQDIPPAEPLLHDETEAVQEEVPKITFRMPAEGKITSEYGKRTHPISNEENIHYGLDIAGNMGDCVISSLPGTVEDTGVDPALGNYVKIRHSATMQTVYGHLSETRVRKGEIVDSNTRIGSIGATGYATGPHLHLEVRIDGKSVNPMDYIGKEI